MKILKYTIKNVRGISEMQGNLDGRSVYVIGNNGAGKSSFIQAIFLACKVFGNKPYLKVGEDKGLVKLELGEGNTVEYTIERSFVANGDTVLTVKDAKGKTLKNISGLTPQKWLDKLLGTSMYYLSEFLQEDPKKQVKLFKEWFKIDTTDLDEKYQKVYDSRTDEGREEVRLKKVVEGHHFGYDDTKKYAEKKDITEISKKLVEINQIENNRLAKEKEIENKKRQHKDEVTNLNSRIDTQESGIENLTLQNKESEEEIIQLEEKIKKLRIAIQERSDTMLKYKEVADNLRSELKTKLDAFVKSIVDSTNELEAIIVPEKSGIEQEIKDAELHNITVEKVQKYSADLKLLQAQEKKYSDLTEELKEIEKERKKRLEDANIPVPGLTFDQNSLIYEDKPLVKDVINDAKIMEVLLTLLLRTNQQEMKKNGEDKLSIFRINGAEITDKTFKQIMEVVQEEGGEIFVEIPDDDAEGVEIKIIEEK